ncbi:Acyl-CoA dehydrogenase/oxidase [Fusarium austroafricanum]|uniref:Acyl-CoA dehydrogenase/oxidase n=1 Tax=Fusarium austroafricanum TaxID=2364996 RepID=A0A8H4P586_9HYPO|nr:Acyl-CoA dehydrogenase/oxidase [Fusarium austroafricanum]
MEEYSTRFSIPDAHVWKPEAYYEDMPTCDKIRISYARAVTLAQQVKMTVQDIMGPSPKFWDYHLKYITTADSAVTTILTIHWNLCMGTIASFPNGHHSLASVLSELERFESVGEFMLTEVDHGLDARNIETTASQNMDGSFDLHTPVPQAAKIMPPATPHAGMSRLAVVFAQLIVEGEKRGVRPFVVRINNADGSMSRGVVSRLLPPRPGAKPVDHAVTAFHHVQLEPWTLLGSIAKSENARKDYDIYTACESGQKRTVANALGLQRVPIITFSTQHQPIITALVCTSVFEAWGQEICRYHSTQEWRVWAGLACVFKQTVSFTTQTLANEMIDRCGWQGLYGYNQMIEITMALRGNSIAEGDKLVLCIRLVSELLLKRYQLAEARNPKNLLAQHELSIWEQVTRLSRNVMVNPDSNRSNAFNEFILPRCTMLVTAIGHRMAYEAALAAGISTPVLKLFETYCILQDPGWYIEHKKLSTSSMHKHYADAVSALLPQLDEMLVQTQAAPWVTAPILKDDDWESFLQDLPAFSSDGRCQWF